MALKILSSDFYKGTYDLFEVEVQKTLASVSANSTHPGRKHVARMLDTFQHQGPNSKHICLVFELLGATISQQTKAAKSLRLPYQMTKHIAIQVLEALDFIHMECGVIHTDIQPSNVLIELPDPESAVAQALSPQSSTTPSITLPTPSIFTSPPPAITVRLNDFGMACWVSKHLTDHIQPSLLRAPEITLGAPWDPSVDIYNLGCLLFEFVTGQPPFPGRPSSRGSYTAEDDRLNTLMQLFGTVPEMVLRNAGRRDEFFDQKARLKRSPQRGATGASTPLEEIVRTPSPRASPRPSLSPPEAERSRSRGRSAKPLPLASASGDVVAEQAQAQSQAQAQGSEPDELPDEEVGVFCDFLKKMMATDPRERWTAGELLRHEWLKPKISASVSPDGLLCPPAG